MDSIRDGLKDDTNALAEQKRQYPYNPDEAFRHDAKKCLFDAERIYQQLEYNEVAAQKLITPGNFMWRNGVKDTEVMWYPDYHGKWTITWVPHNPNAKSDRKKNYPGNSQGIVAGCDPYDHSTTTDGRRSDAAAYVFRKYNPAEQDATHCFVAEYLNRPPKVEVFYEDILMMCVFYGCQILVENNKVGLINYFRMRGYENYLMNRPETTHTKYSTNQQTPGIPTAGAVVINAIADAIQAYVYDNVGFNQVTGLVGNCYFDKLLKDWLEFELDNRTKYDASMASGIALLAAQKFIRPEPKKREYVPFVRKYNINGKKSKLLKNGS